MAKHELIIDADGVATVKLGDERLPLKRITKKNLNPYKFDNDFLEFEFRCNNKYYRALTISYYDEGKFWRGVVADRIDNNEVGPDIIFKSAIGAVKDALKRFVEQEYKKSENIA